MNAAESARRVASGELAPTEALAVSLSAAERLDPHLHAFITIATDTATQSARALERRITAGEVPGGSLLGVPIAVKDLEATAGLRTTYGSPLFADHIPEHDSIAVERLRAAGAIVMGKTNTSEFGLLGETRSPIVGETVNPWDLSRTVGGSSGGSAAAVAAGIVSVAVGSDTAGSIPCPAAMCGVFGIKPTRGLVPTWPDPGGSGLFLDSGALARSVANARLAIETMAGPDPRDPSSLQRPVDRGRPRRPLRIAWNPDWGWLPVDAEVMDICAAAASTFEVLGHDVEAAYPPIGVDPFEIADPLLAGDMWRSFEDQGIDVADLGEDAREEVRRVGRPSLTEYVTALDRLRGVRSTIDAFFERYDLMLSPATAVAAFPAGQPPSRIGGREVAACWTTFMPFQMPCNLAGLPTASIPCGFTVRGLPVGLQLTGPRRSDFRLLDAAEQFERARPWRQPSMARDHMIICSCGRGDHDISGCGRGRVRSAALPSSNRVDHAGNRRDDGAGLPGHVAGRSRVLHRPPTQ